MYIVKRFDFDLMVPQMEPRATHLPLSYIPALAALVRPDSAETQLHGHTMCEFV